MKRVLVTGATGFLGGAVARNLKERGWEVIATGRNPEAGENLRAQDIFFAACDLARDPERLGTLLKGCDAAVHCAALSSPWGTWSAFRSANVTATRHVIQACQKAAVPRLVHISSPSVSFAFKDQHDLREDAPWVEQPANFYIATKREAERMALAADSETLSVLVLRPKALTGQGDTTLLPRLMRVAGKGVFPLLGQGDPMLDLTWIEDAIAAVYQALEAPQECSGRVYHITSGHPLPRSVVLDTVFRAAELNVRYRRIPLGKAMAVAGALEFFSRVFTARRWEPPLTRYTVGALGLTQTLDISAARRDLHYDPSANLAELLAECGASYRTGPPLSPTL